MLDFMRGTADIAVKLGHWAVLKSNLLDESQ